jgi:hypothetical protein
VALTDSVSRLRGRLQRHGYHVFLRPDRPAGWWVVLRRVGDADGEPLEVRAATRDEALALAERFFVTRRIGELDEAIRSAGHMPPVWDQASQSERLEALADFAHDRRIPV